MPAESTDLIRAEGVTYPLVQGTVLRLIDRTPRMQPGDFIESVLVKLRPDSKFYESHPDPKQTGVILKHDGKEPGWVYVTFPKCGGEKGYTQRYRIGLPECQDGACDLDLAVEENRTYAVVAYLGQIQEFPILGFKVQPGDIVKIDKKTERVVGFEIGLPLGGLAYVVSKIGTTSAIVDVNGARRTVFTGKFAGKLVENGRIVLDATQMVILENFGLDDDSFTVAESSATWKEVHGQDEACERFTSAIEEPTRYPELYKLLNKKAPNGILLYGPPGCSKTMIMKAVFNQFIVACKEKGVDGRKGFFLISGPEVLEKYVGAAEGIIRNIFARANKFYAQTGIRPIIAIDEGEAILAKRDSGISSDILKSIVPTFLAEWQGVRESKAIVVVMTNKPNSLDSAITRPGRLDIKIPVKRPTPEACRAIFLDQLKGVAVAPNTSAEALADAVVKEVFSPTRVIYDIMRREAGKDIPMPFTFANIMSGAMIPVIAEEAKTAALKRLKAAPSGTPLEGIRLEEVTAAVDAIYAQNFPLEHREVLDEFTHDYAKDITEISKRIQITK